MLTLRELMTPAPVTITPGATLRDAVELLAKIGVNALPVTQAPSSYALWMAAGTKVMPETVNGNV